MALGKNKRFTRGTEARFWIHCSTGVHLFRFECDAGFQKGVRAFERKRKGI
jgi:hypothetical protein